MDISKFKKSESTSSTGSSILKSHKPRQALQNVYFDFSLDENSPTTISPKLKRRVSFAEKKHVKQFCHLTDQGTIWDSTYEEHDISHKGFNDTEERCMILNEKSQSGKIEISNISHASSITKSTTSNNNIAYRNFDGKENYASTINKKYETCFNNIESELDKTCIKDISMEFTAAIPISSAVSSIKKHAVKNSDSSLNNLSTNCCNMSMEITEALPVSMESTRCNLGIFEQITMIPNYKNAEHNVRNDILDNTIFPINIESDIISKSIIFNQNRDVNYTNDSMALTTVIQSTDTCHTNNIALNTSMEMTAIASKMYENYIPHLCNKSVECSNVDSIHDSTLNTQSNIAKQEQDINYTNNSMMLTNIIEPTNIVTCHNTTFDTSMEITAAVKSKMDAGDIRHYCNESIIERNDLKNINIHKTEFFNDVSIEMTRPVNIICTPSPYNKENLKMVELRSKSDRTVCFLNTSMEMTEMISKNSEIANLVTYKSISDKNTQAKKDKSTEFIVKDTTDFQSNLEDNINDISESNFLIKSLSYLENSSMELESIKPPLFVCLDSEEEDSFHILHQNEPQVLKITDDALVNNRYNNSDQSTTNNQTKSVDSETEVLTNNQNNQTKNYYENITGNKTEENQEVDCHRINKAQIQKEKYSRKRINSDEKIENNFEKEWPNYLNVEKSMEVKQYIDTLDKTEVLITDTEKYTLKENANAVLQIMEEEEEECIEKQEEFIEKQEKECIKKKKEQCIEKGTEMEQSVGQIEDEFVINQNWFLSLCQRLEIHGNSDYCIWNVYYKNIDRRIITFGFMANSLLVVMYLSNMNCTEEILKIQKIKIISCVTDDSGVLIKIVHKLILEKLNTEALMDFCKTQKDILPILDFVSQDITLVMDFMFELKRLNSLNLMEISTDKITFISRSKHMDIILKVTIKVKCFDKLTLNDIDINCLLGTVREKQVRNLITNVKKDYKFLTRYMNDVKNYLNIMEETLK